MVPATGFPSEVRQGLNALAPNLIEKEQYMDFLRNRTFRQSLVCHQDLQPCYNMRGAAGRLPRGLARPAAVRGARPGLRERPKNYGRQWPDPDHLGRS